MCNQFVIKTYSANAVKCEGKGGAVDNEFWLITFNKKVENNQPNSGMISLYKDGSSDKKSTATQWTGKMKNIKS